MVVTEMLPAQLWCVLISSVTIAMPYCSIDAPRPMLRLYGRAILVTQHRTHFGAVGGPGQTALRGLPARASVP
jgi:hypothetical protein